ncbi:MAG: hypothetical protein NTU64_02830, partial [Hyphomicrobiales bacterium]|nr:hypothetical protein [Hyphomicrobiales bacterium]
ENPAERKALESYYTVRQFALIWIRDDRLTGNAKAAIARLKNASVDALDASDYPAPDFAGATTADALAAADIRLTQSILTFVGRPHRAEPRRRGSRLRLAYARAGRHSQAYSRGQRRQRRLQRLQSAA